MNKLFFTLLVTLLYSNIMLFAASTQFAKEYKYFTNYAQALQKSKQTNKPIMLLITTHTCPWCRKLEAQTLRKPIVDNYIQNNYIPLSLIKDKDSYPQKFEAIVTPTIYLINSKEKNIGQIIGYKPVDKFIKKLKNTQYIIKPIVKTSPYSLENLKAFHVGLYDRSKLLSKNQLKIIKSKITKKMKSLGINTSPKEYSKMVIKIESVDLGDVQVLNITLRIIEDVIPKRDTNLESIGITYYKNDLFELEEDPLKSIEESIFQYLIPEFLKQYKEEN